MDPNAVAGMIFTLSLAGLVGGFILLYPLAKRAANLMDSKVPRDQDRQAVPAPEVRMLAERVELLESELTRLRERQDFTEGLVARREPDALSRGSTEAR